MKGNFIDGKFSSASGGKTLASVDPSTGQAYGEIADSSAEDVDRAVLAARKAFDDGAWGKTIALERGRMLSRMSELVLKHAGELSQIETRDTGKPKKSGDADIKALARYFEFYGGAADKYHGDTIPYLAGYMIAMLREPHGVTGHILPWNYPAQMFGRTLAPSLAVGNATVLKPAEDACDITLRLAELSLEAGFPAGAINVVTGRGAVAGAALASHPAVDFISFTGSPEVGRQVQKMAADHFAPCTLELGGKSPHLVFADADFDAAVPIICRAIIQNTGQSCSAGSRVLIEESAYGEFVNKLGAAFSQLRVGSPEMDLDCGPVISEKARTRVQGFIERAKTDRIAVIAEGKIAPGVSPGGFFVTPTLFGGVPRTNSLARDEVFGPVLAIIPFKDEADAVKLANDTEYGLVAAVWTRNGARQLRVAKKIRGSQIFINCFGAGAGIELPFGGTGKSGHGREKGLEALHDFSRTKTLVINHE